MAALRIGGGFLMDFATGSGYLVQALVAGALVGLLALITKVRG